MSKKLSIALAASAGLLATIAVFIGVPSIIYEANPGEFSSPFLNIVASYAGWAAGFLALAIVPALLLPRAYGRIWAALVAVMAVYIWGHGVFQTHSFGAIDGQNWSVRIPTWQITTEALAIAVGAVLVFAAALRLQKMLAVFFLLLAAGLLLQSWPILRASEWHPVSDDVQMAKVADFSKQGNALVVLLDTMASDVFEEVVTQDPALGEVPHRFKFSTPTRSVRRPPPSWRCRPSTPARSPPGRSVDLRFFYGGCRTPFDHEQDRRCRILVHVGEPDPEHCPQGVECLTSDAAMRSKRSVVRSESIDILDAVLFRLAPLGLKNAAYNEGEWVLRNRIEDERFIIRAVTHNYFLQDLAAGMTVTLDRPTLKFLHLMNTHPPYVFGKGCGYVGRQLESNRENFTIQVRCAPLAVRRPAGGLEGPWDL